MRAKEVSYKNNILLNLFEAKRLIPHKLCSRFPLLYGLRFASAVKRCNRGYNKSTQPVDNLKIHTSNQLNER